MANDENSQPVSTDTVGSQLKKAREGKGLTASDVADAQHLRTGIIHYIESAEYEQIGSELFLKGYVRAYAVHVGLDADAVIADLDRELEPLRQKQAQELESSPLVDIERRRRKKRQIAMVLLPAAVVAIVGALLYFFVFSGNEPEPETAAPAAEMLRGELPPSEADPLVLTEANVPILETGSDETAGEQTEAAGDTGSDAAAADDEVGTVTVENDEVDTVTAETGTDAAAQSDDSVTGGQIPVAATSVPVAESPEQPPAPAPEGNEASDAGRVQISFVDDCWIRITDAQGNRLVNALKRSGDLVDVAGEPPLRLVVGAMSAVDSIRFQGLPVNISGFTVINNRSEFTLEN